MTVHNVTVPSLGTMTEQAAVSETVRLILESGKAGIRAALTGAIAFRVAASMADKEAVKRVRQSLTLGLMNAGYQQSTANKRVSQSFTAADDQFFPWKLNLKKTLAANCDTIMPAFDKFWHGAADHIRANGPDDTERKPRASGKGKTAPAPAPVATVPVPADKPVKPSPKELATVASGLPLKVLVKELESRMGKMDSAALVAMRDKFTAEIAVRAKAASEAVAERKAA